MAEQEITFAHLTPPMLKVLADTANAGQRIPSLRRVFFVGDSLTRRDTERVRSLSPEATCIASYGTTETQRAVGYYMILPDANGRDDQSKSDYPLGRGLGDTQLLVLNEDRRLASIGEFGEVYVRSPHLARGYLNDAALSAEKFLKNPFTDDRDDRLYKTGDMGRYLPDGNVQFAFRTDQQVKIRGYRIELGEIENVLARQAAVREAVVVSRQDAAGDKLLIAYIVPKHTAPTAEELRNLLRANLPEYMVPSHFISINSLPLTPNGKVNRHALPEPDKNHRDRKETYREPRTSLEAKIAALWAEVLRIDKVGIDDNFFDLGGHSLLATQVIARMRALFDCDLPLRALFEAPRVSEIAAFIMRNSTRPATDLDLAQQLRELESMTDEEAEKLIVAQSARSSNTGKK
jgi:acyl-coenzyme A synthetase/AMP-(fatty) acid ligase/acyl carrier protein